MPKRALIIWGGWEGHDPGPVSQLFDSMLREEGYETVVSNSLDAFLEHDLTTFDLIVPVWTMGEITYEQCMAVWKAVAEHGVGLAGCHGGMCDAFRASTEWQFMTGGQWVAHPGDDGVEYTINICKENPHEITDGLSDFEVCSEQYYLHVDPGVNVLATCDFPHPDHSWVHAGNPCKMPQVWTKSFGKGRVFYNALGHNRAVFDSHEPTELMRRGFLWASR